MSDPAQCACYRHTTPGECLALRYHYTDTQRDEQRAMGEVCECSCHDTDEDDDDNE